MNDEKREEVAYLMMEDIITIRKMLDDLTEAIPYFESRVTFTDRLVTDLQSAILDGSLSAEHTTEIAELVSDAAQQVIGALSEFDGFDGAMIALHLLKKYINELKKYINEHKIGEQK